MYLLPVDTIFVLTGICRCHCLFNVYQASQRLTSDDHVRKIVREEGRTARNLVTWNVPLEDQGNMMH